MNIYNVSDKFYNFICFASSKDEARTLHPNGDHKAINGLWVDENEPEGSHTRIVGSEHWVPANSIANLHVVELGIATNPEQLAGIISSAYIR